LLRVHGTVTNILGWVLLRNGAEQEAVPVLDASRDAFRRIDGLRVNDLSSAAGFAEASGWQAEAFFTLGRPDEAKRTATEGAQAAQGVLQRAPYHMQALRSEGLAHAMIAAVELDRLHMRAAEEALQRHDRNYAQLAKLDPDNTVSWNNLAGGRADLAYVSLSKGRVSEAMARLRWALEIERQTDIARYANAFMRPAIMLASIEAELGKAPDLAKADYRRIGKIWGKSAGDRRQAFTDAWIASADQQVLYSAGEYKRVAEMTPALARAWETVSVSNLFVDRLRFFFLGRVHQNAGMASLHDRGYPAAEAHFRKALAAQKQAGTGTRGDKSVESEHSVLIALALARQGKREEAFALLEPEIKFQRELLAQGSEDLNQHLVLASAHFAAALSSPAAARTHLREAAVIVDRLPPEMLRLRSVAQWRAWIAEEKAKRD
jgi:hypothetical protein